MSAPPKVINGRYALIGPLGRGDDVLTSFLATDVVLERPVVVKLFTGAAASQEEQFRKAIGQLSELSDPGLVRLFDGGTLDGLHYLVTEHVDGARLADMLACLDGEALEHEQVRRIGIQVARALAHAHERGIAHGALSPNSIVVDDVGVARVRDLGLAHLADETLSHPDLLGPIRYLAPEQSAGTRAGPAADMYALGVVLAECLGVPPEATSESGSTDPGALSGQPGDLEALPEPWRGFLRSALAADPGERVSATEVVAHLTETEAKPPRPARTVGGRATQWMSRATRTVGAMATQWMSRAADPAVATGPLVGTAPPGRLWAFTPRAAMLTVSVLASLLLAAGVVVAAGLGAASPERAGIPTVKATPQPGSNPLTLASVRGLLNPPTSTRPAAGASRGAQRTEPDAEADDDSTDDEADDHQAASTDDDGVSGSEASDDDRRGRGPPAHAGGPGGRGGGGR